MILAPQKNRRSDQAIARGERVSGPFVSSVVVYLAYLSLEISLIRFDEVILCHAFSMNKTYF